MKSIVVFTNGIKMDSREFGQILPTGSIPVAFVTGYNSSDIITICDGGWTYISVPHNEESIVLFCMEQYEQWYGLEA